MFGFKERKEKKRAAAENKARKLQGEDESENKSEDKGEDKSEEAKESRSARSMMKSLW